MDRPPRKKFRFPLVRWCPTDVSGLFVENAAKYVPVGEREKRRRAHGTAGGVADECRSPGFSVRRRRRDTCCCRRIAPNRVPRARVIGFGLIRFVRPHNNRTIASRRINSRSRSPRLFVPPKRPIKTTFRRPHGHHSSLFVVPR